MPPKSVGQLPIDDRLIGDEYDKCYESIARLVAQKAATDMWGAVKISRLPIQCERSHHDL